jgi:hypothetical protein
MRFSDLSISDETLIGNKIELSNLFGKRIVVEKIKFRVSKYRRNDEDGSCMLMQICIATFNNTPDKQGDYFVKNEDGSPKGERRFTSTGSAVLIDQAKKALAELNKQDKPFILDTTIQKIGKSYQFT